MIEFRRVNIGRDSFGVMHYVVEALGLPEDMSCRMSPEEADRPAGEWMVNAKASEWCLAAKPTRPAKRKATK